MKRIVSVIILLSLTSFRPNEDIIVDESEALKAFNLINDIRINKEKYVSEFPFLANQKIQSTELAWNKDLARVAERKAYDMANRNFYAHVDPSGFGINYYIGKSAYGILREWTKNKRANNFESIAANTDNCEHSVRIMIIDDGVPSLGHRNHLLGIDPWNASMTDIGIGFARRESGSKYQTYTCIIIAKHNW